MLMRGSRTIRVQVGMVYGVIGVPGLLVVPLVVSVALGLEPEFAVRRSSDVLAR